jgi:hypothetical protein
MNEFEEDDSDDARKPAARPSPIATTISKSSPSTTHDNDNDPSVLEESADTNDIPVMQSVTGEIPFLVTHWLSGYPYAATTARVHHDDDDDDDDDQLANYDERKKKDAIARHAAMQQIQRATAQLAVAFQTLGAFGTTRKVCYGMFLFLFLLPIVIGCDG